MRETFVQVVTEALNEQPRVALVLADITVQQFRESGAMARHRDRVINAGIREQLMVSMAGGMALEGMRPIVHTFAPFLLERAFEQVKLDFGHQGVSGVFVSIGASYDIAAYGRTHHCPEDVALISTLPGWRVQVPGHADEAAGLLRDAIDSEDSVYIRLSERENSRPVGASDGLATVRRGAAGAITVIAVGPMLDAAIEAVAGIEATLLYATTVRPFDAAGLQAATTGTEVVLIEPYLEGTSAGEVSAALSDRPHRLLSIGVPRVEQRRYGSAASHDRAYGLDAEGLRRRVTGWLGRCRD